MEKIKFEGNSYPFLYKFFIFFKSTIGCNLKIKEILVFNFALETAKSNKTKHSEYIPSGTIKQEFLLIELSNFLGIESL